MPPRSATVPAERWRSASARRLAALLGSESTPCRCTHTCRVIHTSRTAQVATTVLPMVDSTIGNASQTAAIEQKNATMSCTSVSAAMITARTAAVRTGSGRRGFAYISFTPPSPPPDPPTLPWTWPVPHTSMVQRGIDGQLRMRHPGLPGRTLPHAYELPAPR
ncbi:hypothetical protein IHE61_18395 [Streptomyces sp. GKU 257-1]|nr:hypothetical protein [Streptomyces sp. GKU 257-1]